MGQCNDKSIKFLKGLGYNVVRVPKAGIRPLQLLGIRKNDPRILGPLPVIPGVPLPAIKEDTVVANVNGKSSSKLKLELGLNILGNVIGAMGGNLGLKANWTNASTVEFAYKDVTEDSVVPLELSAYLADPATELGNPLLTEYLFGDGSLYILSNTLKSKSVSVSFEKSNAVGAEVDIPAIQALVGGSIKVSTENNKKHVVTFEGTTSLVFGFQCWEISVDDGVYKLLTSKPGTTFLSAGDDVAGGAIIKADGGLVEW